MPKALAGLKRPASQLVTSAWQGASHPLPRRVQQTEHSIPVPGQLDHLREFSNRETVTLTFRRCFSVKGAFRSEITFPVTNDDLGGSRACIGAGPLFALS